MEKAQGSMGLLSAMQITADTNGLDIPSKTILQCVEVLAVILKGSVHEYKEYTLQEIIGFIEADTITSTTEVSPGRTNTEIRGDNTEFFHLNEKTTHFDLAFRAKNPQLSTEDIQINLQIDIEPQKTYKPGYPIEKRGIYYLARRLSSQLSLALEGTDYSQLTKCYSIWICRDDVPPKERYSISFYEMANTKNTAPNSIAKENYDLMTLVVIKLGNEVYNGGKEDEGYELLHFLNAIMYPHKEDFMATVTEYIDYPENTDLWKGVTQVSSLEQVIFEGAIDDALKFVERETREVREALYREKEEAEREKEKISREKEEVSREKEEVSREKEEVSREKEEINREREEVERKKEEINREREEVNRVREEVCQVREEVCQAREEVCQAREEVCQAREEGIQAIILDNLEEQVPKERIVLKLQKHFNLTKEKAEHYYKKYA